MKPILVLAIAVLASAATSLAVVHLVQSTCVQASAAPAATAEDVARLSQMLADGQAREASLAKSVEDLRAEFLSRPREDSRVPVGDIESAVARALKEQGDSAALEASRVQSKDSKPGKFDAHAAFQDLLVPGLSREDAREKWKAIDAAGGVDEVLALFEQYAREHPESAGAQVELGGAYLQKVFKAGNGPEAGVWATKADKAFDGALSIDDHSWDARFSKAVSLSFWPPVFGKQTEAIKHFEILAEQQAQAPPEPRFAQTWLLLGNLYQQLGNPNQALATWQKGLSLFPDNAQIQKQIANAQGH
jgi:tetratricopeptide (TPR) repeat protein